MLCIYDNLKQETKTRNTGYQRATLIFRSNQLFSRVSISVTEPSLQLVTYARNLEVIFDISSTLSSIITNPCQLYNKNTSNFDKVQLMMFSFMMSTFCILFKKYLLSSPVLFFQKIYCLNFDIFHSDSQFAHFAY